MQNKSIPREYLGAFKCGHRKNVREYIDEDYSWDLLASASQGCPASRESLLFLSKFNFEYYRNGVKKGDPKALHSSDRLRKDCYSRTNAVNRDLSAIIGSGLVNLNCHAVSLGDRFETQMNQNLEIESVFIELLDHKRAVGF